MFLVADKNKVTLSFPTLHFRAHDGTSGGGNRTESLVNFIMLCVLLGKGLTGRNGENIFIKVPLGTIVSEVEENELAWFNEESDESELMLNSKKVELNSDREMVLVAQGGKPGLGNVALSTGKNRGKSLVR